jgi:3-oxoacyl-[acyl-carrier-protein] synthase II
MVGAAGAMGLVYSLLALQYESVPATANLFEPDAECDLDYVPLKGRAAPGLHTAMCNAFGFGGPAATVVLRRILS